MKKLFLASILAFSVLRATEENIWESRGAYVKYGLSSPVVIPIFPALGFGYFWKEGIDFSVMVNYAVIAGAVDAKLLALPVVKERYQFGVGVAYIYQLDDFEMFSKNALGVGGLIRFVKPEKKSFFQIEVTQPAIRFNSRAGSGKYWYLPNFGLMWGYRF